MADIGMGLVFAPGLAPVRHRVERARVCVCTHMHAGQGPFGLRLIRLLCLPCASLCPALNVALGGTEALQAQVSSSCQHHVFPRALLFKIQPGPPAPEVVPMSVQLAPGASAGSPSVLSASAWFLQSLGSCGVAAVCLTHLCIVNIDSWCVTTPVGRSALLVRWVSPGGPRGALDCPVAVGCVWLSG